MWNKKEWHAIFKFFEWVLELQIKAETLFQPTTTHQNCVQAFPEILRNQIIHLVRQISCINQKAWAKTRASFSACYIYGNCQLWLFL